MGGDEIGKQSGSCRSFRARLPMGNLQWGANVSPDRRLECDVDFIRRLTPTNPQLDKFTLVSNTGCVTAAIPLSRSADCLRKAHGANLVRQLPSNACFALMKL